MSKVTLQQRIEKFIQLGETKYGKNAYDYSSVAEQYIDNRTPILLTCTNPEHKPFLVYPFSHTSKGDNQKGTCKHCRKPYNKIQEKRWDLNISERIEDFKKKMLKKHGKGSPYTYPHIDEEYKNEKSYITVVCNATDVCKANPYKRVAHALKNKNRYGGCERCNEKAMKEKIRIKNKARQLRNYDTKDVAQAYGCIYKISHIASGKFYIGYTTMTAQRRFKSHADETKRMGKGIPGRTSYLHNAMLKYGVTSFKLEILEEFKNVTPLFLANLEMEYIAKLNPHYNLSEGGEICRIKRKKDV